MDKVIDYIEFNKEVTQKNIEKFEKDPKWYEHLEKTRYRPILRWLFEYVDAEDSLLDIGIREGYFLDMLYEKGFTDLIGMDIYDNGVQWLVEKGIKIIIADAQDFNIDKKFKVIIASHLIEHCPEPQKVIDNIYKHLEDDGIAYIEVPKQKKEKIPTIWGHYSFFPSLKELCSFFEKWKILKEEDGSNLRLLVGKYA